MDNWIMFIAYVIGASILALIVGLCIVLKVFERDIRGRVRARHDQINYNPNMNNAAALKDR